MNFLNQWLSLLLDIGLIAGLFFLWLSWYRNGKRQQKLESLLSETARQLQEASQHLSVATRVIEQLKQQDNSSGQTAGINSAETSTAQTHSLQTATTALQQTTATIKAPPQNSTQASMIMRMQREGDSANSIAERLDIPLAQVKLMLKLHATSQAE